MNGSVALSHAGEPADAGSVQPLLELALAQIRADGAYLYLFDENRRAFLAAWAGLSPPEGAGVHSGSSRPALSEQGRYAPVVLHENAWTDWRFSGLAVFARHRFEGVVSIPLAEEGELVGVADFCRLRRATVPPRNLSLLLALTIPLTRLLSGCAHRKRLEAELEQARQALSARKLLDRAKGILQSHNQWTEEQAYFHIRRQSRQRRIPMRDVAAQIIDAGSEPASTAVESQPLESQRIVER
jgi:hypothetical protein